MSSDGVARSKRPASEVAENVVGFILDMIEAQLRGPGLAKVEAAIEHERKSSQAGATGKTLSRTRGGWTLHKLYSVARTRAESQDERYGQALFNTLVQVRPDIAERLQGSCEDPFCANDGADRAVEAIEAMWPSPPDEAPALDAIASTMDATVREMMEYALDSVGAPRKPSGLSDCTCPKTPDGIYLGADRLCTRPGCPVHDSDLSHAETSEAPTGPGWWLPEPLVRQVLAFVRAMATQPYGFRDMQVHFRLVAEARAAAEQLTQRMQGAPCLQGSADPRPPAPAGLEDRVAAAVAARRGPMAKMVPAEAVTPLVRRLQAELRQVYAHSWGEADDGSSFVCTRCRETTPASEGGDDPEGLCDGCWCAVADLLGDGDPDLDQRGWDAQTETQAKLDALTRAIEAALQNWAENGINPFDVEPTLRAALDAGGATDA